MTGYMGMRGTTLQTFIGICAGLCFIGFGYGQSDIGGLLTIDTFRARFPEIDTLGHPHDLHVATIQGITVATWNIGCFVSALICVYMGDYLGRKTTIAIGCTLMIIGKLVQASSYNFGQLIAGRFIAGFGNGFNTATVPAWQAECVKAHRRGTMLMISSGACISFGVALAYWMDFAFAYVTTSSVSWRLPTALQGVPAILALCLLINLPDSPRWLISQGREDEALNVLAALGDLEPGDEDVRQEFIQIKDAIIEMSSGGFSDLFKMGEYRLFHRTVLASVLQLIQQFSGINLFIQYLALLFITRTGFEPWVARLLAGCCATSLFLASFASVIGIDRFWGRRSMTIFGACGMAACMAIFAGMDYMDSSASHIAQTVFMFAFVSFFAFGWQGMSWLWAVELTPLQIRGPANAVSTSINWLANFTVVLITPIAFDTISWKTYIIFACVNAVAVPFVYFFCPETGMRSLEEVDVLFHHASQSKNPWLSVVKVAKNEPLWYGKDGETPFVYEQSDWHQHFTRTSRTSDESHPSWSPPSSEGYGVQEPKIIVA